MCMKKRSKTDLILLKKLKNKKFKVNIAKAYTAYKTLNIKSRKEFYIYAIYLDVLKTVTYEEIIYYDRLLKGDFQNRNSKTRENTKILSFTKRV